LRLIVGLGNPGERYALTRHNIGARVVEAAASRWAIALGPSGAAAYRRGRVGSAEVALASRLTWMNQTGLVVKGLLEELTLAPHDLVVVHDDLDLPPGRLRIKRSGGSGGHNGVLSVLTALETNQFCRLKIGVGRPTPGQDSAEYVLTPFSPEERALVNSTVEQAVLALECLVVEGAAAAMNRFNVRGQEQEMEDEGDQGGQKQF